MIIETLSTFPGMYDSVMGASMMRRAQDKGILDFTAYDLRDWTYDRHRTTDDDPYGGGAGLVMKCEPLFEAVEAIAGMGVEDPASAEEPGERGVRPPSEFTPRVLPRCAQGATREWNSPVGCSTERGLSERLDVPPAPRADESAAPRVPACPRTGPEPRHADGPRPTVVFLAPQGRRFDDALACELAAEERLLFVCGHYEGIDERAYALADVVISLGDYVLTSGELASMVVIDAVVRKLPGVLGAADGAADESFASGLLEYPQYTRPAVFRGAEVPAVLLSGDHGAVARWRREQSLARTAALRPDLLEGVPLTPDDRKFLENLG
ncbi:tRNA (guanine(37)-N(1))-methyltransferase [Enterorhabdus sp. P55]|uniref:tRNA (guanine(37)-N(1))-methyltransferase n=1 Tax=Enterorhabdus sp. P55 TaxID=2304571 RepID=UPI001F2F7F90|nr:tRNA (guanine(37)-N(1))-methyltransferase [Enterorhabdus sp. P55]